MLNKISILFYRPYFLSFLIYFSFILAAYTQNKVGFDPAIQALYKQIINLDLKQYEQSKAANPNLQENACLILLDNYADFFSLFISENKQEFQSKKNLGKTRINQLQQAAIPQEWKNYLIAEIQLQWALIYLKNDDQFAAFQNIRSAFEKLESNKSQFPNFIFTYKSLGIIHCLLSTIPAGFSWATKLIGLTGSMQLGKSELNHFLRQSNSESQIYQLEANAALSFILSYLENKPLAAYRNWQKVIEQEDPNPLISLVLARLAMKASYNDAALNAIESLPEEMKAKIPFFQFLLGLIKLQKLDPVADKYFKNYLHQFKGNSYIKESYQKLAWHSILFNQSKQYKEYMNLCQRLGNTLTDEDKQAQIESRSDHPPDLLLLKARLLCDGSYARRAYNLLIPKIDEYYKKPDLRLEAAYRTGRICQFTKQYDEAILYFEDAIRFDINSTSFMSCAAKLYSGQIMEEQNRWAKARDYYNAVLDSKPDQYQRSLHQKAKTGLARIKAD